MSKMPTTVLVTGGAGYIGSHIVLALLEAGYYPVVLDDLSGGSVKALLPDVPFYEVSVGDFVAVSALIKTHTPESVIHCAGSIIVSESFENLWRRLRRPSACGCPRAVPAPAVP
jgi:UDP-glucose 4-epimerase